MMQKDQLSEAIQELQLALREETFETPTYLATLASAYVRIGRSAEAIDTFERARQMAQRYGQVDLVEETTYHLNRLAARNAP
jgi:Tfp pilus assembly protein PilF